VDVGGDQLCGRARREGKKKNCGGTGEREGKMKAMRVAAYIHR
jgi:hypothetical protein